MVPSALLKQLKQPDPLRTLKPPFLKVEHWSGVEELVKVFVPEQSEVDQELYV